MLGNPSAAQKRYHDELREMYADTQYGRRGVGELHHIFGSKEKFKLLKESGVNKPGEWFVVFIPRTVHSDIKSYSFEEERSMFFNQGLDYIDYFGKDWPVPNSCLRYYNQMLSKHHRLKFWGDM